MSKTSQQTYDLTQAGFKSGINDTLDVCAAEETLDTVQQNLIESKYARLVSLINLYQALGGGWTENSPQPATVSRNGN